MAKSRMEHWLTLLVVAAGLAIAAMLGLLGYLAATPPLHPHAEDVPAVTRAAPLPQWVDAVAQARHIARAAVADRNLPGASVAVGVDGDLVWAEGFGWADLGKRVPVAPDTRFRIGTASTALTSAAVGLLLEKHRLNIDEPIHTYVPEFPDKPWPVTLRQIMGHTAGLRNDGGDEGPLLSERCERPSDALRFFANAPLLFEPGTRYRYSNYDWIVVSAAIEDAADQPFFTFMRTQVFEPLGMRDTMADSSSASIPHLASFYFPRFAADPRYGPDPMREVDYSCYAGSSAFVSTPSDLVRFAMAIDRGTLLQAGTVASFQTSQRLASGEETGYGLGWDLETVALSGRQTPVVGHDGDALGGMVASFMTFRDLGIVVSVVSNIWYADTFGLATRIAEPFADAAKRAAGQ